MLIYIREIYINNYSNICNDIGVLANNDLINRKIQSINLNSASLRSDGSCLDLSNIYIYCESVHNYKKDDLRDILIFDEKTVSAVIIDKNLLTGCPYCFDSKLKTNIELYGVRKAKLYDSTSVIFLTLVFHYFHNIPIAICNIMPEQNWSLMMPLANCNNCKDIIRTPDDFRNIYVTEKNIISDSSAIKNNITTEQQSNNFLENNRLFIGFSAVMSNFVKIDEEKEVNLIGSPIFLSNEDNNYEISGGKGKTLCQAAASCLGEGLERYFLSGIFSEKEIKTNKDNPLIINIEKEFGFPYHQPNYHFKEYEPNLIISWVKSEDLTHNQEIYLPSNIIFCPDINLKLIYHLLALTVLHVELIYMKPQQNHY
ncbi:YcaO-like family protein [Bartonella sp. DGB1]|uniref:YcaO-like family protein n=1 Tax=Bartonella sp. DGB1 TaxID=3239807 RepID=UPI003525008B